MITAPESNVKLTDVQKKQLETFRGRLSNIEAEITIAQGTLQVLKDDVVKATKEKKYLLTDVETLTTQVADLQKQKDEHNSLIVESQNLLRKQADEHAAADKEYTQKKRELSDSSKDLSKKIATHQKNEAVLNDKSKKLSEDRLSVEKAKAAFLKASESVSWK